MRTLFVAAAVVTLDMAAGHFVASLHSNFIVNLDFEETTASNPKGNLVSEDSSQKDGAFDGEVKVMSFAGGKKKFRCRLPVGGNRSSNSGGTTDVGKVTSHFLTAKLAPLRGTCWQLRKDYWSYEACFGKRISQFRPENDVRFSLGEHMPKEDQLLPNGHVRELYLGGTGNRSTEVNYVCGSAEARTRDFEIEENRPLVYSVKISGPQFCAWREEQAYDENGKELQVSSLLEELRGSCINSTTQGWWTYEYCFPWSLVQFHFQNGKRDPVYIIGTLNGTSVPSGVNQVPMTVVRRKPSISPRERRAPPSNHRTLRQRLGGGNICDETNRPRTAVMDFQCPPNWQSRPETRIVSITEGSLCEYEILIHTTLLCGHHKFIPSLPKGKEAIQCTAERDEL